VRCNDADEGGKQRDAVPSPSREKRDRRDSQTKRSKNSDYTEKPPHQKKDDWRSLMNKVPRDLIGPEPDFSEEGWAMRKPRKKKK
jgi:ATP-dependent RNA helicase DeaD